MTPLPSPSSGAMIVLAFLTGMRDQKGIKWCRARGVGGARKALNDAAPDLSSIAMITADRDPAALKKVLEEARLLLAMQCRLCGKCDLAGR